MNFYEAFLAEMEKVTVFAEAPATAVVGACTRAAKRAQMVMDGESVSAGPWVVSASTFGTSPLTPEEFAVLRSGEQEWLRRRGLAPESEPEGEG